MSTITKLNPRQTVYSQEYRDELRHKFLEAFYADPFPFAQKLKNIGISKGCFSSIKNLKYGQNKIVLNKMRCYVDGVKYEPLPEGYKTCCICEEINKIEDLENWSCKDCRYYYNHYTPAALSRRQREYLEREIKIQTPGEYREKYLQSRRRGFFDFNIECEGEINEENDQLNKEECLRDTSDIGKCMELVNEIRSFYETRFKKFKEYDAQRKIRNRGSRIRRKQVHRQGTAE